MRRRGPAHQPPAAAAQQFLATAPPDLEEVRANLADIVGDDHRASAVICRLRGCLRKGEFERLPLDPVLPPVRGDQVQRQQVVLNLMLNALEAMTDTALGDERENRASAP